MNKVRHFIFAGLGASLCLSISGTYIFGGLALAYFFFRRWKDKEYGGHLKFSSLDLPLLAYVLWGALTTLLNQWGGWAKAIKAQDGILFFFLFAHFVSPSDLKKTIIGFCAAAAFAGLWGILQGYSGIIYNPTLQTYHVPEFYSRWPSWLVNELASRMERAVASRSHPLTYAETLMPAFFIFLTISREGWDSRIKPKLSSFLLMMGLLLTAGGLLASQGRGIWLGLALGIVTITVFFWRETPKLRLLAVIALCLAFMSFSPSLRGRAATIFSNSAGPRDAQLSKSIRTSIWLKAAEIIRQKPFLGVGVRKVSIQIPNDPYGPKHKWSETHNIFIQSAAERGLVGLGLLLWIFTVVVIWIRNLNKSLQWRVVGIFVAFMIAGLTESWLNDVEVASIFWAFLGTIEAFSRLNCYGGKN